MFRLAQCVSLVNAFRTSRNICPYNGYICLYFNVSMQNTSSTHGYSSSYIRIPVSISSVSPSPASIRAFSSSIVRIPLSISPSTSSRINMSQPSALSWRNSGRCGYSWPLPAAPPATAPQNSHRIFQNRIP